MPNPARLCAIVFATALLASGCDYERPRNLPPDSRPSEPGPDGGPPPESAVPRRNSLDRLEFPLHRFGPRALPQRAPTPMFYTC